jgi:hypothetical protein
MKDPDGRSSSALQDGSSFNEGDLIGKAGFKATSVTISARQL